MFAHAGDEVNAKRPRLKRAASQLTWRLFTKGIHIGRDHLITPGKGVRRQLARARNAVFYAVPPKWRGRIAAAMPARLAPPLTKPDLIDHFYDKGGDPFGFDVNPDEQLKFRKTLEICGDGKLGRVLEIGCAVGSFTEMIASRATDVLAIDVSEAAIRQAKQRLHQQQNVRLETRTLPAEFPDGQFDLIIASDVLYYLTVEDLQTCMGMIEAALSSGGAMVAVHYIPRVGTLLDGNELHDLMKAHSTLSHTLDERTEFGVGRPYRVDRYEKK